jgi:hypothetical protein
LFKTGYGGRYLDVKGGSNGRLEKTALGGASLFLLLIKCDSEDKMKEDEVSWA